MNSNVLGIVFLGLLFFLLLLFHATVVSVPIFLSVFIIYYIVTRKLSVFFLAFFVGIVLDIVLVRPLGITSIFLVLFLFFVILYEKKFEIDTPQFVFFGTFLGSVMYLFAFWYSNIFLQAFVNALLGVSFYVGIRLFLKKKVDTLKIKV